MLSVSCKEKIGKQAETEQGQAQLKMGLGFTPTNLHQIDAN